MRTEKWILLKESDSTFKVEAISDKDDIVNVLSEVLEMVVSSYKDGYKGCSDLKRLKKTTPLLKIVRDGSGNLLACSIYRAVQGSFKVTGVGQNKTPEGKLALQEIIKSDITPYSNWIWAEVSGAVEHYFKKHNGYPLPNEYAALVLEKPSDKIELMDDGFHYKRIIGQPKDGEDSEPDTKVIFGFKNEKIAEEVLVDTAYEIRREHFNSEIMTESGDEPYDFHYAVSFVDQLSDLYDEEGFRSIPPELSKDLDNSIEVLRKYIDREPWVKYTLENALSLRESMPMIKFI